MKRVVTSGAARMLSSYAFGFITQGIYFIVIARTLGASEFGLFTGAIALVSVLACLVGVGAGNVLVLETARDPLMLRPQMGTAIMYILATAVPFALIALSVGSLGGSGFLSVLVPLIVSEIFTLRLFDLAQQVFQAKDQLGRTALCGILSGLIRVIAALAFSFYPTPTAANWSLLYAGTTALTSAMVLAWAVRATGRPVIKWANMKTTWRLGIYFSLGTASRTLYTDADKYILSSYGLLAASGALSAATKIITMASAPIQAMVYSLNTKLFRAGLNGPVASWGVIRKPFFFTLAYGVLIGVGLALASPLIPVILGPSYQQASSYLWALSPLLAMNGIHYLFGDALMGLGRQALRSVIQFSAALVAVIANVAFIPVAGPNFVIVSAFVCSFGLALFMAIIFTRLYRREKRDERGLSQSFAEGVNQHV